MLLLLQATPQPQQKRWLLGPTMTPCTLMDGQLCTGPAGACLHGHSACVEVLLASGADPNAASCNVDYKPLHTAAVWNATACVASLLAAGAHPYAVDSSGWMALHMAAFRNCPAVACLLLQAAPQTALTSTRTGLTPVEVALEYGSVDAARCLLELGLLPPAGELLFLLHRGQQLMQPTEAHAALALYPPLVARLPLSSAEWQRVPAPCPGLGVALPAVLQRSADEAAQLVRHMPPADRERLRTAAPCVARAQQW